MASLSSSNQQCVWWFSTSSDKQLLFKKNFTTDFLVHSVKAGFEQKTIDIVMQSVGEDFLQKVTTPLKIFKPVDPLYKELAGISSRTSFVSQLTEILEENSILYATEEEETTKETPAAKKMKYEHKKTFFEECLGPLDSSFREQIFVSALPTSCFDLVEELNQSFKDGHVRTSFKKTLMTGGVFQCLVGAHSEDKIMQILNQLNDGEISLTDFRIKLKNLRYNYEKEEEDSAMKEIELVRLRREVHRLKAENRRLTTILMENSQEKETETVEPEVQTVGPEDQTVEPEVQTVEPEVQTVEPEDQTDEPEVSSPSVGGLVMARWSPDKVYYEAKVLSVTKRNHAAIVMVHVQGCEFKTYTFEFSQSVKDESSHLCCMVMIYDIQGEDFLQKVTTPLKIFKPVDPLYKELAGISSRTSFVSQLTEILEENSILYATEEEETTKETLLPKR
ncbi:unnamed protein product [Mytilus edulis]|uniref:Uncharacterized protein n=1 Tax=Mytilus edulis TaxID=6550 RepID=A0A8S3VF19_MYTED|nr:unnamed protein product [Mytilus edulis]